MKKQIIIWTIVFLVLIGTTLALGIAPAKTSLRFERGKEYSGTFKVVNNDNLLMDLRIYPEGLLAEYIEVSPIELHFEPGEQYKKVAFTIRMHKPKELVPGTFDNFIVVEQTLARESAEGETVTAKLKLRHRLIIEVPHHGKYIEPAVEFKKQDDKINVTYTLKNLGEEDIESAKAYCDVSEEENKLLSLETEETPIKSRETKQLSSAFDKSKLDNGTYQTSSSIRYDEYELEILREFTLGEPVLRLLHLDKYIIAGKINKMSMELTSNWNTVLDVYADLLLFKDSRKIAEQRTPSFELEPDARKTVTTFIDARELPVADYNAYLVFYYSNKTQQYDFTLTALTEEDYKKEKEGLSFGIIILIIAIVVVFSINFALMQKRKKTKYLNTSKVKL